MPPREDPEAPPAPRPDKALASLIRKSIRGRRGRAVLMTLGVATSTLLVMVLLAAFRNPTLSLEAYLARPGIDLWVCPLGTDNLVRTAGFIPMSWLAGIREVPGVAVADPLVRIFVRVAPQHPRVGREPELMLLAIGYRVPGGLGAPPAFGSGRAPRGETEVALDRAAAYRLGVGLGDTLIVNGREAAVVGLTRGTNLLATQFLFFDVEVAERASGLLSQASFFVVRLGNGDSATVARRIEERFPSTSVIPRDRFLANSLRETASGFLPVLMLVASLGVIAATLLVALLVQGLVEDRRTDFAVLMAMGAAFSTVSLAVVLHVMTLIAAGCALGGLLLVALQSALDRLLPTVQLNYAPTDVAIALVAFALAGAAGAVVPTLRLKRIDPLEAFRT